MKEDNSWIWCIDLNTVSDKASYLDFEHISLLSFQHEESYHTNHNRACFVE